MPVPFFFHEESAEAFHAMPTKADDVFVSSIAKGGTTWVTRILFNVLHGFDDTGQPVGDRSTQLNAKLQLYPEALPLERVPPAADDEDLPPMEKVRRQFFGTWGFEDLVAQPSPRLITTHLFGEYMPASLTAPGGQGKMIIVLRNLKDTLSSLHYFRGEAKDGWTGNEHGPGSLARYIDPDSPNAYGAAWRIVRDNDALASSLAAEGRVLVVYYEALKQRLPYELDRINAFLGRPSLTAAKKAAVLQDVGFDAMSAQKDGASAVLLRKGGIGDWRNHLNDEEWAKFDEAFDRELGGVALAEPMRWFQLRTDQLGLPPARTALAATSHGGLEDDPRTWPRFVRATLVSGSLVRDGLISASHGGTKVLFERPPSEFKRHVDMLPPGTPPPPPSSQAAEPRYVAEAGRYHLLVSGVCPWASSVRAVRHLLGLEEVITMDVADGQTSGGWVFLDGVSCAPWAGRPGPFFLHEVYQTASPGCTTRLTVPVLWDTRSGTIVSNDSWGLCQMLCTTFASLGTPKIPKLSLYPTHRAEEIDAAHTRLYANLLNGVYRAGIARLFHNEQGAASAEADVYAMLEALEAHFAKPNAAFLLGASPTLADIRLTCTLLRYDASYVCAFGLHGGKGSVLAAAGARSGYPHLQAYVQRMYKLVGPTVEWAAFRQYYRWGPAHPAGAPLPPLDALRAQAEKAGSTSRCKMM